MTPARPNILLLCMDQWDVHMGLPAGVELPALERLMGAGVTLDHQYCTVPLCTPSRAAMWTGRHAKTIGMWDNTNYAWTGGLDPQIPTIGTMLRELGYYTAFKGKWHLSHVQERPSSLEEYGFSDYQTWGDNWGGPMQGEQLDGTVAFEAVDWLRHTRPTDQPWLLIASMVNPHDIMYLRSGEAEQAHPKGRIAPMTHPPQPLGAMAQLDVQLPPNFHDDLSGQPYGVHSYKRNIEWNYGRIPQGREDLWKVRRSYLINCLRLVDAQFQRILDELDRLDLWKDTVVVLTSDHGEMNGAHGLSQKGGIAFQEATVVQMTVVTPGGPRGRRSDAIGSHLDLATTMLSWAGLDEDAIRERYPLLPGRDLRPVLESPEEPTAPRGSVSAPGDGVLLSWDGLSQLDPEWSILGGMSKVVLMGSGKTPTLDDVRRVGDEYGAPDLRKRTFFRAVADGRHKLVRWFSPEEYATPRTVEDLYATSDVALYDLAEDPGELENIGDPEHPRHDREVVAAMLAKLVALIDAELGEDEAPFDLDIFGTREVRYTPEGVDPGGFVADADRSGDHADPAARADTPQTVTPRDEE